MKEQILNQVRVLKQQYEDLISKEIRTVYNEFVEENKEKVEKILSLERIPLFFLEKEFINWIMKNKKEVVKETRKGFLLFDIFFVIENRYCYPNDYLVLTGKWCDNEKCSGNIFHQLPYFDSEKISFSIFTVKDFPELLKHAAFDPSKFIQLDFEDVGKKNCFIYPTSGGCVINSYGDWAFSNVPFETLEGKDDREIRTSLIQSFYDTKNTGV